MNAGSHDETIIDDLLRPASVALIGANDDASTFSGAPLANLLRHGFRGVIYPVNPRRAQLRGIQCFPSVADLPQAPQAAVITIGAANAVEAVRQCADAGVRSVTLVSSGFGEGKADPDGQRRNDELRKALAASGMRLLGPNTTGEINLWDGYVPRAAYNHLPPERLRAGRVALVTQSGACSNVVFNRAQAAGVGVGYVVATGGQIDLTLWEVGRALLDDPRVRVLTLVAEDLSDRTGLEALAETADRAGKGVVLLKLGQTVRGGAAVLAHSASLAGDAEVQRAACRALGVHWVDDFDQLWEVAHLLDRWGRPDGRKPRLGILAFSGGEGAMIADAADRAGFELPAPGGGLRQVVDAEFAFTSAANPFDPSGEVIGNPDLLRDAVHAFVEDESFTEVLLASPVFGPELAGKLYPPVTDALARSPARVVLSSWSVPGLTDQQQDVLRALDRPMIDSSIRAVAALSAYHDVGKATATLLNAPFSAPQHAEVSAIAPLENTYSEARDALAGCGLTFAPARRCFSEDEASAAAAQFGFPVVLKADVPSSTHKSADGLVMLGLTSDTAVRAAYRRLADQGGRAVVVEAQATGELQCFLGIHRDPTFGPVLIQGTGGVAVESLRDTQMSVLQYADEGQIDAALRRTAVGGVVARRSPAAAASLVAHACGLAKWFVGRPDLSSVEINPILIDLGTGVVTAVDARIMMKGA